MSSELLISFKLASSIWFESMNAMSSLCRVQMLERHGAPTLHYGLTGGWVQKFKASYAAY